MVYPEDISAQNALRFLASQENFTYQVYLITFSNLAGILSQRKNISAETKKALEELAAREKWETSDVLGKKNNQSANCRRRSDYQNGFGYFEACS